ncbi:hypothetical protein EDD15DRAFT_2267104, partial [Pisolithus albus]
TNHSTFHFPFLFLSLETASEYCVTFHCNVSIASDERRRLRHSTLLILEWNRWTMLHVLQHSDSLNLLRGTSPIGV